MVVARWLAPALSVIAHRGMAVHMPAAETDFGLAIRRANDERAADQMARTQRAFNLYCLRMPARLAVVETFVAVITQVATNVNTGNVNVTVTA